MASLDVHRGRFDVGLRIGYEEDLEVVVGEGDGAVVAGVEFGFEELGIGSEEGAGRFFCYCCCWSWW